MRVRLLFRERNADLTAAPPEGTDELIADLDLAPGAALAAGAEREGLVITPGSVFAPEGGLASFVRLPYGRPPDELRTAVRILTGVWATLDDTGPATDPVRLLIA